MKRLPGSLERVWRHGSASKGTETVRTGRAWLTSTGTANKRQSVVFFRKPCIYLFFCVTACLKQVDILRLVRP